MKILFFIGELTEGGAERVISILANNLVERGFDIEILKYYTCDIFYKFDERVKITTVEDNTHTKSKIRNFKWVKNYISNNCDIIISFLAVFNMYALLVCGNKPIIVADRNDPSKVPSNILLRTTRNILYRKANTVVLQTEHNKNYFSKYVQRKSVVINNPIDLKDNIGLALRTKKENLIVSVGRLEPQKNQTMLIEAFNEIKKKHNDYKLVIYGEGSYRTQLENSIKELNLEDSVFLPGNQKDIFNKIACAKVFVLSSNYEGMPNALTEAMCLGLPCISTKVSGANELIDDEINGLLINVNDIETLIINIKRLIEDNELREKIAFNAVALNERLDVETTVEKWIEIINNI